MPLIAVFIAPLLALYLKFRVVQFAFKLVLFGLVYTLFKNSMQFVITTIMTKMGTFELPCMASYILNSLDIFSMINFGLSVWGTIYIGRFLLNSFMKLV